MAEVWIAEKVFFTAGEAVAATFDDAMHQPHSLSLDANSLGR